VKAGPQIETWQGRSAAAFTPAVIIFIALPALATASCINLLVHLRGILNELAWAEQMPDLAQLLRREDVQRMPQRLPRPLTAQQDEVLQKELLRRNDLGGNAFLLVRHTGMRIGECADLPCDCLHSTGPDQWAIHVPTSSLLPVA
jgi:hypothetical protein